jgi:hypothetical protein
MSSRAQRLSKWVVGGATALAAAATVSTGRAGEVADPLLDALIKKGILTEQEARDVQTEIGTNNAPVSESKWKINNAIKSINLFGDVRFRYEYRGANNPEAGSGVTGVPGDTYYRERFRYALRVGVRGDLFDDFNYGIRLETSANPRSPWVTFGDDTSPTPFSKSSDGIGIGQAYLGWHPTSWYEMEVGKMPQPLYTTPMVWDSDLNPEGAFEKFKYSAGKADFFAGFGQFVYSDTNPDFNVPSSDMWMFAFQVGATVNLTKTSSFKIAPVLYKYLSPTNGSIAFAGQGLTSGLNTNALQSGINNLLILEIPAEYNVKLGNYHARVFGDFALNLDGDARARAAFDTIAGVPPSGAVPSPLPKPFLGNNMAYQVGFGFGNEGPAYGPTQGLVYGSTSKKNTWESRVYWQHVEQYALDANLLDSDFFEGRANLQGIYAAFAYSFTDAIIGTVRYGYARRINDSLGTGGSNSDLPILNPVDNYHLVQLDLTWRF